MSCPACGSTLVASEMTPAGKIRICAGCSARLTSESVVPSPPSPRASSRATPAPERQRLTASGVVAAARREARELRKSIRLHERALKAERRKLAELDRLLNAAADRKPRAVVRPIRTTA